MSSRRSTDSVAPQLRESLARIGRARPERLAGIAHAIANERLGLRVGDEALSIDVSGGVIRVGTGIRPDCTVWVGTDRSTIAAVVGGSLDLSEAVENDRIRVKGSLESVLALYDALDMYCDAVVHVPGHATTFHA